MPVSTKKGKKDKSDERESGGLLMPVGSRGH